MLTLSVLQFPATGGLRTKQSAREVAQKRITRIQKFFCKSAAGQALRRDSLVLQLTSGVEAFMSTIPKDGEIPTLVALQHGKAHDILNKRLQRLLDVMHLDPDLNLSAATGAVLVAPNLPACHQQVFVSNDGRVRCRVLFGVAAPRLCPRGRNPTTSFPVE